MQAGNGFDFINGFQAISRGAYEGGASFFSIQQYEHVVFPEFDGLKQEKFQTSSDALGVAFGFALAGKRSQVFITDLPLKLLTNLSYTGVNGALVIVYLEDCSDLQLDSRPIFKALHLPILEPANPSEVKRFIKIAYNMSEKYDVPIVIRCNKDMLNCGMEVEVGPPKAIQDRTYKRDVSKYALSSSTLKLCLDDINEREKRLAKDGERFPIHSIYDKPSKRGIVAAGEYADLANEVLSDKVLKLGTSYPLPIDKIREFSKTVDSLIVIEEHSFIQETLLSYGINCIGKELFIREGRHSAREIAYALGSGPALVDDTKLPIRTADFCKDCPYAPVFIALKRYEGKVIVPRNCSVYASGYLSVAEVAMDSPLSVASGFAAYIKPLVVISERDLLRDTEILSFVVKSGVKLILLSADSYDVKKLLDAFGISCGECSFPNEQIDVEFKESVLLVHVDRLCKYEK